MMLEFADIGILADDLTGACDAAACFASGCGPVAVLVSPERGAARSVPNAVINTQSRLLAPEQAREVLRTAGRELAGNRVIFKKIDSALRGPVGAELAGLIEGAGERTIVLAPAIPKIGRTVRNGIIYDVGVPIDRTPYAGDAASPVDCADIARVLERTGDGACEVPDVESDDDMRRVVERALGNLPVVLAGSIGLADALAGMVNPRPWNAELKPARRVVVVCGSLYRRALDQLQAATRLFGVRVLAIDGTTPVRLRGMRREEESTVIVRVAIDRTRPGRTEADFISTVTETISGLIREIDPEGLGVIGGETAFHLLRSLGTTLLDVHERIGDVMTTGVVRDGVLSGRRFATKGGSVGQEDAVVRMIHHLKGIHL